jgi:hypothetical protein
MIDRAVDLSRRPHAQRDGDAHRKNDRKGGEFERSGKPLREIHQHRLPCRQRVAEISMKQVNDVVQELYGQRPVKSQGGTDACDRIRICGWSGEIGCGISGQRVRQQKRHHNDAE